MNSILKTTVSENCGPRKHGLDADMVVLHYTAMQTAEDAIERLCDPVAQVSAHYVISELGAVHELVDPSLRAWHAGAGQWGNVVDVNSHSIGIELANATNDDFAIPFSEPQMTALEGLLKHILNDHLRITPDRIIGHSDMAVGRKNDPGPKFDWRRLALAGLSVWPSNTAKMPADWGLFQAAAVVFGYSVPDGENGWHLVLDAFRQRFAPYVTGELTAQDVTMICALARDYPCKNVDLGTPIA